MSAFSHMKMSSSVMLLLLVCSIIAGTFAAVNGTTKAAGSKAKPKTTPVPEIKPVDAVVLKEYETATLQCSGAQVIAWYKANPPKMLTNELENGKYVIAESVLNITKVGKEDIGVYVCYDALTRSNYTVQVFMTPIVKEFQRSQNMAAGDNLKLLCNAYGWPMPTFSWVRMGMKADGSVFSEPLTVNTSAVDQRIAVNGSLLMISPVIIEDYMNYTCIASNSVGLSASYIIVRVKGRFTAVWPFIGIVIQVVILVVIILFFEKKKAKEIALKQAKQEEEEKLLKAEQARVNDALRQRK